MNDVTFRTGTLHDSFAACEIFYRTVRDLVRRTGQSQHPPEQDADGLAEEWASLRSLYEHLAQRAEHFVLAEIAGRPIGYARSLLTDGVRELTEFFVLPGNQSNGLGRELLARAFPEEGARQRVIIATTDTRALVRYMKTGVYPRFPIYNFSRPPRQLPISGGLTFKPLSGSEDDLSALAELDRAVLGYTRPTDHRWWTAGRKGFLVFKEGQLAGYGYSGFDAGPFALLDHRLFPDVLAYAENLISGQAEKIHLEVPLVNHAAVDFLLSNDYQMSSFTALLLSETPFGRFENYISSAPPFVL